MDFSWPFPVLLSPSVYFNPLYRSLTPTVKRSRSSASLRLEDKDSTTSSTDNNGHQSDSGLGQVDRHDEHGRRAIGMQATHPLRLIILDDKYSTQVSHTTSKGEMNVDLTPKKHKDFCTSSVPYVRGWSEASFLCSSSGHIELDIGDKFDAS